MKQQVVEFLLAKEETMRFLYRKESLVQDLLFRRKYRLFRMFCYSSPKYLNNYNRSKSFAPTRYSDYQIFSCKANSSHYRVSGNWLERLYTNVSISYIMEAQSNDNNTVQMRNR